MARLRHRKRRHGKCPACRKWNVPYAERSASIRGKRLAECPVLHPVNETNEEFLKFREARRLPLPEED